MRQSTAQFRKLVEIVIETTKDDGEVPSVAHTRAVSLLNLIGHAEAATRMADEMINAFDECDGDTAYMQGAGHMLAKAQQYATTMWQNVASNAAEVFAPPF